MSLNINEINWYEKSYEDIYETENNIEGTIAKNATV